MFILFATQMFFSGSLPDERAWPTGKHSDQPIRAKGFETGVQTFIAIGNIPLVTMERRPSVLGVRSCIIPRLLEGRQIISLCPRYPECWADGDLSGPAYDALGCTRLEYRIICAVDLTAKRIPICEERKKNNQSCGCCWRWSFCNDVDIRYPDIVQPLVSDININRYMQPYNWKCYD